MNGSFETFIAIPKNSRLKEDVAVGVDDALKLEERDYGVKVSPDLPGVKFVSRRLSDILNGMRQKVYEAGLVSDEVAFEDRLQNNKPFGKRIFGMETRNSPQMRYLVRTEDRAVFENNFFEAAKLLGRDKVCITSFPGIYSASAKGSIVVPFVVDGQVESYLRTGELGDRSLFAMDLVSSGKTAEQFGLVPVGKPILTAYPSLWRRATSSGEDQSGVVTRLDDIVNIIQERFAQSGVKFAPVDFGEF